MNIKRSILLNKYKSFKITEFEINELIIELLRNNDESSLFVARAISLSYDYHKEKTKNFAVNVVNDENLISDLYNNENIVITPEIIFKEIDEFVVKKHDHIACDFNNSWLLMIFCYYVFYKEEQLKQNIFHKKMLNENRLCDVEFFFK